MKLKGQFIILVAIIALAVAMSKINVAALSMVKEPASLTNKQKTSNEIAFPTTQSSSSTKITLDDDKMIQTGEFLDAPPQDLVTLRPELNPLISWTQYVTVRGSDFFPKKTSPNDFSSNNPGQQNTTSEQPSNRFDQTSDSKFNFYFLYPQSAPSWSPIKTIYYLAIRVIRLNDFFEVGSEPLKLIENPPGTPTGFISYGLTPTTLLSLSPFVNDDPNTPAVYQIVYDFLFEFNGEKVDIPVEDFPVVYFQEEGSVDYRWATVSAPKFALHPIDYYQNPFTSKDYLVNLRADTSYLPDDWKSWHWGGIKREKFGDDTAFSVLDITFPIGDWFMGKDNQVPKPENFVYGALISLQGIGYIYSRGDGPFKCYVNGRETMLSRAKWSFSPGNLAQRSTLRWDFDEPFTSSLIAHQAKLVHLYCPNKDIAIIYPSNRKFKDEVTTIVVEPFKWGADRDDVILRHHRGVHFITHRDPNRSTNGKDILNIPQILQNSNVTFAQAQTISPPAITRVWNTPEQVEEVIRVSTQWLVYYPSSTKQSDDGTTKDLLDHIVPKVNAILSDDKNAVIWGTISPINDDLDKRLNTTLKSYIFSIPPQNDHSSSLKSFSYDSNDLYSNNVPTSSSNGYHISLIATGLMNKTSVYNTVDDLISLTLTHNSSKYNPTPSQLYPNDPYIPSGTVGYGIGMLYAEKVLKFSEKSTGKDRKNVNEGWEIDIHSTSQLYFRMKWCSSNETAVDPTTSIKKLFISIPGGAFSFDDGVQGGLKDDFAWLTVFDQSRDSKSLVVKSLTMKQSPHKPDNVSFITIELDQQVVGSMIEVRMPWVYFTKTTQNVVRLQPVTISTPNEVIGSFSLPNQNENSFSTQNQNLQDEAQMPIHLVVGVDSLKYPVSIGFDHNSPLPLTSRGDTNGILFGSGISTAVIIAFVTTGIVAVAAGFVTFLILRKKFAAEAAQNNERSALLNH